MPLSCFHSSQGTVTFFVRVVSAECWGPMTACLPEKSLQLSFIAYRPDCGKGFYLWESHYLSELLKMCKIYGKYELEELSILVHSSTEPAVFLQMFETPLLLNLFYLIPHVLPPRTIFNTNIELVLFSRTLVLSQTKLWLSLFLLSQMSSVFTFQKLACLWNPSYL